MKHPPKIYVTIFLREEGSRFHRGHYHEAEESGRGRDNEERHDGHRGRRGRRGGGGGRGLGGPPPGLRGREIGLYYARLNKNRSATERRTVAHIPESQLQKLGG